jgi:hypothetical protein
VFQPLVSIDFEQELFMENIAVDIASHLSRPARAAIEDVLGRALRDDERVSVMAFLPHSAPTGAGRTASAARLKDAMDILAAKALPVDSQTLEDALDEAMEHVRPGLA